MLILKILESTKLAKPEKSKVGFTSDGRDMVDNRDKFDGRNKIGDDKIYDNKIAKKKNY